MLYRTIPKNGDSLSILGFGCMRLPEKNGRIDEPRAIAQIRSAIDGGVTYIDTAMPYHMGASEQLVGKALAGGYRERVRIATKLPRWQVRERRDMDAFLDAQLANLRTGEIDYYLLHNLDLASWEKLRDLGVIEFLDAARRDGRIRNAGFSFHSKIDDYKTIVDSYDWALSLIQYNYLDEYNQAGTEGLRYAASKGLGVAVMEPLRGGKLARHVPPAVMDLWESAPVRRTPAEWALRWVWDHPEVTVVLSGMNEEAHIAENLRIAGEALPGSLTPEEHAVVARVERRYRELLKVPCTGCRYCMPCQAGVDIPTCFEFYNNRFLTGKKLDAMINYLARVGKILGGDTVAYASLCKKCGKCERVCPQEIQVMARLEEVAREFEGVMLPVMTLLGRLTFARQRRRVRRGHRDAGRHS